MLSTRVRAATVRAEIEAATEKVESTMHVLDLLRSHAMHAADSHADAGWMRGQHEILLGAVCALRCVADTLQAIQTKNA